MSKRIIAMLLAVSMIICLTACGTTNDEATTQTTTEQTEATQTDAVQASDETPAPPINQADPNYNINNQVDNNIYVQPGENQAQPNTPANNPTPNTPNAPAHVHHYSSATCTSPQRCSCGATIGSPLGHNFSSATCTSPKKCSRCGMTQGSALGHNYVNNKCTRCGKVDPDSLPVGLEKVHVIDSLHYNYEPGTFTDSFGNKYDGFHSYLDIYTTQPYSTFYLNEQYSKFTGTIVANNNGAPADKSYYVYIYADNVLVYSKTDIKKTTGKVNFSINVKGVQQLTIKAGINQAGYDRDQIGIVNAQLHK